MTIGPYDTEDLRRGLGNPALIARELGRQSRAASLRINDAWYRRRTPEGYDLAEEEWDVLVILDGCRYDLFEAHNTLDGTLESRVSPASESWEFLQSNFAGRTFHDTVYVTANPHWYKLDDDTFHHVVDLLAEAWDEDYGTVLPRDVVEHARAAHERFPNKRLIVHFMQPHFPFIGEKGRELDHKGISMHLEDGEGVDQEGAGDEGASEERADEGGADEEGLNVWTAAELGKLPIEDVADAYAENLELVLPHVETLIEDLPGRTVVTADHGNLVGDRLFPLPVRGYGHPRGLRVPALVTVPWLTVPGERIPVQSDLPTARDHDTEHVDDRLEALGYR